MKFKNLTILITGASSGLGAEFARQFHSFGAKVILVARRADRLNALVAELNNIRAESAEALVADLGQISPSANDSAMPGLDDVVKYIQSHQIDILVNNAGRGSFGYYENIAIESEVEMVNLNIIASMKLAHAIIPQLKQRRSGAIVYLSSIAGSQPMPFMSTYAATKAFDLSHALGLRYELKPFNVRVLSVCPGPVETEFGGVARVPGSMTDFARDSAQAVVAESLRALRNNKAIVVPCLRPKGIALLSRLTPRAFSSWVTGRILKDTLEKVRK